MEKKRRYNIGLVVGNIEDDFSNEVCKGAMRAAELVDDNLFIIPVKYLGQTEKGKQDPRKKYEYQYNFLLSYARSQSLDMVLLCLSTIAYQTEKEHYMEILHTFKDIPILLIASKEEGYSSIKYDNMTGLGMGIRYLIEERNCRHIAMLTGSKNNEDAIERLQVYQSVLAEKGLPIEERKIAYGDFSEKCVDEVEQLLLRNPDLDAIVCANDAMAKTVYQILNKYHFSVGKDICVMGFDDVKDSAFMEPPLATVQADASVLGHRAVVECHGMLSESEESGEPMPVKDFMVDTAFINRESASGIKEQTKPVATELELVYLDRISLMLEMNHSMNIISRDMLMFDSGSDQNYARFLEALTLDGVSSYYLYMLRKPLPYERYKKMNLPEAMYLKAYRNGDEIIDLPRSKQRVPVDRLFQNDYYPDERKTYVLIDIYSRELQYGILLCDIPYRYFHYVEMLCYQISIAVKIKELFAMQEKLLEEQSDMLRKLEKENLILDDISNKDELTGILNRRGFMTKMGKCLNDSQLAGSQAAIIYADLNYLKLINDRYTHAEGNFAIKCCAEALESAVGQNGVACRIGGDEFAGFALAKEAGNGNKISEQIKQYLEDVNAVSGKPYEVTASVGVYEFTIGDSPELKELLEHADERLYADKSKKEAFKGR